MPCEKLGTGWRVIAIFNIIAVFLITILGSILVFWGTQRPVGTSQKPGGISAQFIFFKGDCKTSKSLNTWLHLLLNAFSTGILASSNFFMQILSSPTRSEIDKAHKANRALKIGVQSLRNVFWTSKIKFVCWILFFISSFPLHLFFNSAIFSTKYSGTDCKTSASRDEIRAGRCSQTCGYAVGLDYIGSKVRRPAEVPMSYTLEFFKAIGTYYTDDSWPGFANQGAGDLTLKYCLVQEVSQNCKVGISNQLLLIVVVSIAVKGFLAVAVLLMLPQEKPLAVLGDAIESFIQFPDHNTVDRCLLDRDIEEYEGVGCAFAMTAPPVRQDWTSAIQRTTWTRSYGVLYLNILLLSAGFIAAQINTPITGSSFTKSLSNGILLTAEASPGKIIDFVLMANLPQLLLSITYFIYNNMFTYLCTEKEWNSYGGAFKPLRVSQPKGQQRSTYRLQLPYRYSIPLMVVSTFMHWFVSNAIYVFVAEGDYYELGQLSSDPSSYNTDDSGTGLSKDAYVGVGYSTPTILVLLIATIILPVIPTLLRHRKVKTSMPLSGASSAVITAACHVPIPEDNVKPRVQKGHRQRDQLVVVEECGDAIYSTIDLADLDERHKLLGLADRSVSVVEPGLSDDVTHTVDGPILDGEIFLREVALSPVRWGVVKTSASWKKMHINLSNPNEIVEHLSFGTELHEVTDPIPGHWYT
ncbi:hypothetical protein FGSG_11451 [Fusarium graminearum PH-1]|uniref:Chromosome 3, complete genome n=1 Tax=Gibberella zeae (strain ATCC MYA-4620 / CBS 123657 / FGSC 9075 / NRRL 31084 / PH-1) TaxID=229533 RepID=I1S3Q7_GIBZE|nr:hypothetical protein FGSG_11451 [Fusarium graminearum PH-1]ESU18146.1 hypothetical protein FGSG_11451 [Fusarium graminearum PH-1]KAI6764973.1 hypothetical protein HG531_012072 [Fusarium graminearum]CEF87671.1 unnamed protein product [Fusarium graminearum]|eukprot:XP_011325768.1 hypothetical protein FGSG_11451 [Fusarium graminearum PH-1]